MSRYSLPISVKRLAACLSALNPSLIVFDTMKALLLLALPALVLAQTPDLAQSLRFRLVGPFRGGRVIAVAGVPSQPNVFYFGGVGGGVWKTTDGGVSWTPMSDSQMKTSSVGAIAVADSDPNVVYAGMGESCVRGN